VVASPSKNHALSVLAKSSPLKEEGLQSGGHKELRTAYAASKAALIGLTRVWALELAPLGITVNAIGPGPIATELFTQANDAERMKKIVDAVPVRRIGRPEDIAYAAGFFLDDRAGFVNGQILYVCGGLTVGVAPI
jgi:3-oxoacyl-[acyl-carrier protein] reductase